MSSPGTPFGRFNLVRKLAAGGMGEVYLAQVQGPAGFEKPVVIKRLLPQFAADRAFVEMFLDEARLAARLHHPNITQIFELGEVDGSLYLAMELVPGVSLEALLTAAAPGERAPLAASLRIALELLSALEYAHGLTDETGRPMELVHRDVTPANVMITPHGGLKLLDFGLATFKLQQHQSETGVLKGKYGYMAPEQFTADRVDQRADVFATGAILYHLATGVPAYEGSRGEVLQAMMSGQIAPARSRAPELAQALEAVLARALARFPAERYPSAKAFREDLEHFAAEARLVPGAGAVSDWVRRVSIPLEQVQSGPSPGGTFLRHTEISGPAPPPAPLPRVGARWRAPALGLLGLAACGAALGAWWINRSSATLPPQIPVSAPPLPTPVAVVVPPPSPVPPAQTEPAPPPPEAAALRPAHAHRQQHALPKASPPAAPRNAHEHELSELQSVYAALKKVAQEEGLTGLEREAYRAALDAYAAYSTGALSEADLERSLQDGNRILRAGAARRGLGAAELPK